MEITVFTATKIKDEALINQIQEYLKRFGNGFTVRIESLGGERHSDLPEVEQMQKHWKLLKERLPKNSALFLLDERGKEYRTEELKQLVVGRIELAQPFAFAIGGPGGWPKEARSSADKVLALSQFTLPYQLAAVMLIEQLYRVYTLWRGIPYHR